ncbi:MFS transporter [Microbacterium sp. A196]|uniref:MFS transporter n=1 Tax=Microbacterium sp. A196 TaxID=3457320 RepID=UPI003FD2B2C3
MVYLLAAVNLVALGSLTTPVLAGIPLKIDDLMPADQRATALATVLTLGGLAALISNPLFGALSDRTRGRFGRRRPWMLGGAVAGLIGVAALSASDSLPAIMVSCVCIQTAFNAILATAAALLADTVAESRRAAASGVFTAAAFVGVLPPLVLTALLPRHVDLVSLVMPVAALAVVGVAMTVPDRASSALPTAGRGRRQTPVSRAFAAVWLQRLAMQSALSLATAFTLYMIIDRMTSDPVAATPIAMIAAVAGGAGIVIGAAFGGALASRLHRYMPFLVCGAVGLSIGASLRAVADVPIALWVASAVGGLAVGAYLAVNLALAMRVLPEGRAGTYLGVLSITETIPQVLVPLVAAGLMRLGQGDPFSGASDNYLVLYASAAVLALLSLATLPALRAASRPHRAIDARSAL